MHKLWKTFHWTWVSSVVYIHKDGEREWERCKRDIQNEILSRLMSFEPTHSPGKIISYIVEVKVSPVSLQAMENVITLSFLCVSRHNFQYLYLLRYTFMQTNYISYFHFNVSTTACTSYIK